MYGRRRDNKPGDHQPQQPQQPQQPMQPQQPQQPMQPQQPHQPHLQQQPQLQQPQGQAFYAAPIRPQPQQFVNQPPNFNSYNRSGDSNQNQPTSPSTTLNFGNGNGFVSSSFQGVHGTQSSDSRLPNQFVSNPQNHRSQSNAPYVPPPSNNLSFPGPSMNPAPILNHPQNLPAAHHGNFASQGPARDYNSSFYDMQTAGYRNQNQFQPNPSAATQSASTYPSQNVASHQSSEPLPSRTEPQPQNSGMQSAVPFMMAGLQQMTGAGNSQPINHAALGAQILQTFAPGAAGYTNQLFGGDGHEKVKSFMRMPKYYFAVNHRYVLRKLSLILMPFMNRTWSRQRGLDSGNFDGSSGDDGTCYLPPRDDVNAPDLYIPVMSFVTYILVVGFVFGTRNAFKAEVLANYFSRGLGVLTLEVLLIKLLLYLINARPTPWLDVIAYRGYKFVGVVLTIVLGLAFPRLYVPSLIYSATAMGIFLMRSHRRIILPRDMEMHESQDLARRNAFLLFVWVLQYPIYWILARVFYVKGG